MVTENELKELGQSLQFQDRTAYVKIDPKTKNIVFEAPDGTQTLIAEYDEHQAWEAKNPEKATNEATRRASELKNYLSKEDSAEGFHHDLLAIFKPATSAYMRKEYVDPLKGNVNDHLIRVPLEVERIILEEGALLALDFQITPPRIIVEEGRTPIIELPKTLLQEQGVRISEVSVDGSIRLFREEDLDNGIKGIDAYLGPDQLAEDERYYDTPALVKYQIGDQIIDVPSAELEEMRYTEETEALANLLEEFNAAIDTADTSKGRQR